MLTIPSDSSELINKGFLVMEDWAHNVTMSEEEIDKERGVIIEEWRLGRGPWQRMRDKFLPVVFKDSRYAERLPIGKKEIIENCDYETLRKFYRDWYRPDLMALVVVGDIDPELAEQKIIDHFSSIEAPDVVRERKEYGDDAADAEWFSLNSIPELAFDHNAIFSKGRQYLIELVRKSVIYEALLPSVFQLEQLYSLYFEITGSAEEADLLIERLVKTSIVVQDTHRDLYRFNITNYNRVLKKGFYEQKEQYKLDLYYIS
jgi:zinc protease